MTSEVTDDQAIAKAAALEPVHIHIEPPRGWIPLNLRDLWEYRELLYFLAWRDIKVRYKQTVLGASWAILQPFFTMVVFSLFFGRLAGIPSEELPYPIFSYAALVPWQFFANGLTSSSGSLESGTARRHSTRSASPAISGNSVISTRSPPRPASRKSTSRA